MTKMCSTPHRAAQVVHSPPQIRCAIQRTGDEVDFVAYHPYTADYSNNTVTLNTADQSSEAQVKAQDFMVASAQSCDEDNTPSLNFTRKMSRIVINVDRKDSWADAVLSDISLTNVITDGTFFVANAPAYRENSSVTAGETTSVISLFFNETSSTIEAIIVPQTTSSSSKLMLYIDGEEYESALPATFAENKQYNYNLLIAPDAVDFTAGTITSWSEVESGDMEPTEFPTYTASEISQYSVPSVDTWIITDEGEITWDLISGVYFALQTAYSLDREITIILPNATSIGGSVFSGKTDGSNALVSIELPNVTSIGANAFMNQTKLTRVDMPKVETIGGTAFYNCSGLTNVDMPKVETIGSDAFAYCTNLTTISDLSGVTSIEERVFSGCSALEIDIKLLKITELPNYVFNGCTNLKSVEIPEVTSIGESAFRECASLVSVDISGVTSLGAYAFSYCSSLAIDLYMPNITTIPYIAFGSCTNLKSVNLPNVEVVQSTAFSQCSSITEAYLPKVTTIEQYAFNSCGSLESIDLPSATSIGNSAFSSCDKLTTLKLTTESAITCGTNLFGYTCDPSAITLYISQINSNVANLTDGTYTFKEIIYID